MALILNIDTATNVASVCISKDGQAIAYSENNEQKEHASFVHAAIEAILKDAGKELADIEAFAVTFGPGSYTGLRVGLSAAKGFCYALNKPLITVNTLEVMAVAALEQPEFTNEKKLLLCPMIDARRMEVFAAIYNKDMEILLQPAAILLENLDVSKWLQSFKILFFGSGSNKFKALMQNENAFFSDVDYNAKYVGKLAEQRFIKKDFANVAYSAPEYLKEFHSTLKT